MIFLIFAVNMRKGVATIVKHTGSHYLLSELPEWNPFPAVARGKLRLKDSNSTNPVAVGDKVEYEIADDYSGMGTITSVQQRKNHIIRKSTNLSRQSHIIAANIDCAYLVTTLAFPETKRAFIDRFLVTCEAYKVPVRIVLNKIDLYGDSHRDYVDYFKGVYQGAGYQVMEVSALTGEGVAQLRQMCGDGGGVSLFSGVSGVGKSSLMKALDPSLAPKIAEISEHYKQGKHTTTFYEMYPLSCGGFVIDTPGIRGFGLVDFEQHELSTYFPEMLRVMDGCRFKPCTHTHEPHCAVKEGVDSGDIDGERYLSYLGMLEEETKYR